MRALPSAPVWIWSPDSIPAPLESRRIWLPRSTSTSPPAVSTFPAGSACTGRASAAAQSATQKTSSRRVGRMAHFLQVFPTHKIEHRFSIRCRLGRIFLYRIIDLASLSSYKCPPLDDSRSVPQGTAAAQSKLKSDVIFFGFRLHLSTRQRK